MPKIIATKDDWINRGLIRFTESGSKGIIVEEMAKDLKVNKSSFYHHFKTKKDFIWQLIQYWVEFDTNQIIREVDAIVDPKSKFLRLIEIIFKKDNNLDFNFFLKKYARGQKEIEKLIDKIDASRIKYVSNILTELGYTEKEANQKAQIFYKYLIGYHEVNRLKKAKRNYASNVIEELSHFISI